MSLIDGLDSRSYYNINESLDMLWLTRAAGRLLAAGKIDMNRDFIEWMRGATNPDMPLYPMPENVKQAVKEVNEGEVKLISETVAFIRAHRTKRPPTADL